MRCIQDRAVRVVEGDDGEVQGFPFLPVRGHYPFHPLLQHPTAGFPPRPEPAPVPFDPVAGPQHHPQGPLSAQVGVVEPDAGDIRQQYRNAAESRGDGAQDTRLSVPVGAVEHGQVRVEQKVELLDGAVVLDLHPLELHCRSLFRVRGPVRGFRRAVSTRHISGAQQKDCIIEGTPMLPCPRSALP